MTALDAARPGHTAANLPILPGQEVLHEGNGKIQYGSARTLTFQPTPSTTQVLPMSPLTDSELAERERGRRLAQFRQEVEAAGENAPRATLERLVR